MVCHGHTDPYAPTWEIKIAKQAPGTRIGKKGTPPFHQAATHNGVDRLMRLG